MTARAGERPGRVPVAGLVDEVARRHGAAMVACDPGLAIAGERDALVRGLDELCAAARRAGARSIRIAAQGCGDTVALHVEHDGGGGDEGAASGELAAAWSRCGGTFRCVRLARVLRFTVEVPAARAAATTA